MTQPPQAQEAATGETAAGAALGGKTPGGETAAGQTSTEQTATEQSGGGETADGETADGQTSGGQTAGGQTSAGDGLGVGASAGRPSAGEALGEEASGRRPSPGDGSEFLAAGPGASDERASDERASDGRASDGRAAGGRESDRHGPAPAGWITLATLLRPAIALLLSAGVTALLAPAAGQSMGLFFGGIATLLLVLPTMTPGRSRGDDLLVALAAALPVACVWAYAASLDTITPTELAAAVWVLVSVALAIAGLVRVARFVGLRAPYASAGVFVVFSLWLTWPIWLAHALLTPAGPMLVAWLMPAHPLFALNGLLVHLGIWTQQPVAYATLMNLNQDVPYALPPGVVPGALLHAGVAAVGFALPSAARRRVPAGAGRR